MRTPRNPPGDAAAPPPVDVAIASLAGAQHGLVKHAQLTAAGLTRNGIKQRVERGVLHPRHRLVYSVGHAALSREGEMLAAVFAAGDEAALSHESAAELLQILRYRASVIAVVAPRRRTIKGVRVHRCMNLDSRDVTTCKGIPVTTVARILVDLSDTHTAAELTNLIHEAAFRSRFHLEATRRTMQRANGRHRLDALEQAIAMHLSGSAGTRSRVEVAILSMLKFSDLPTPLVNTDVLGEEVGFHWPERRLIVEVDGPGHRRPRTRREDERRDRELRAGGWTVLRYTAEEIEQRPHDVMRRLSGYEGPSDA